MTSNKQQVSKKIWAVVPFSIGHQDMELHVTADFTPVDPPEPDEYEIVSVEVKECNGMFFEAPAWLFRAVVLDCDDGLVREKLDEVTEQWEE